MDVRELWHRVLVLEKANVPVRAHTRTSKTGKVTTVGHYSQEREAAPAAPPASPRQPTGFKTPKQDTYVADPHPFFPDRYAPSTPQERAAAHERDLHAPVPPESWDLWVNPDPQHHLQATYVDFVGRKQYRYARWYREQRESAKFEKVLGITKKMPEIRQKVEIDLKSSKDLTYERVAAAVIKIIDSTMMRVGSEDFAVENGTFGASSLRKEHVQVKRGKALFFFAGKDSKQWEREVSDPEVVKVIKALKALPGERLFQFKEDGVVRRLDERQVNDYLGQFGQVTAKDFRTYHATRLAAELLTQLEPPDDEKQAKKVLNGVFKQVAEQLGNTAAVCRRSYVNPAVVDAWSKGKLKPEIWKGLANPMGFTDHSSFERMLERLGSMLKNGTVKDEMPFNMGNVMRQPMRDPSRVREATTHGDDNLKFLHNSLKSLLFQTKLRKAGYQWGNGKDTWTNGQRKNGFWLSPKGEHHEVQPHGHAQEAYDVMAKHGVPEPDEHTWGFDPDLHLQQNHGYVRGVRTPSPKNLHGAVNYISYHGHDEHPKASHLKMMQAHHEQYAPHESPTVTIKHFDRSKDEPQEPKEHEITRFQPEPGEPWHKAYQRALVEKRRGTTLAKAGVALGKSRFALPDTPARRAHELAEEDWEHPMEGEVCHRSHLIHHTSEFKRLHDSLLTTTDPEAKHEVVRKMRACAKHRMDHMLAMHLASRQKRELGTPKTGVPAVQKCVFRVKG